MHRRRHASPLQVAIACGAIIVMSLLLLCWPLGCKQNTTPPAPLLQERTIRIRVVEGAERLSISAAQPPIYFTKSDPTLRQLDLPRSVSVPVTHDRQNWLIGRTALGGGDLVIRPTAEGSVHIDGRAYRGELRLVPLGNPAGARFDVVNDVDIDDYLRGVLAKELYPSWEEETFKAQAIAARTYALYQKFSQKNPRHWDLHDDTRSQMYGGIAGETAKASRAVDATAGIVLTYGPPGGEKIFKAYFSSCCGGIGQSSHHAFDEPYQEPLSEQFVGALCSSSTKYNWGPVVVTKAELTQRFRRFGRIRNRAEQNMQTVYRIDIQERNRFGRPVRFVVTDTAGAKFTWVGEELRWAVNTDADGATMLYSSFVENIINEPDSVRFLGGHGHGHGVGMCQWCAEARARAGMRHEDIVLTAYPAAKLKRAY
jgi:stage II sporulation protein D